MTWLHNMSAAPRTVIQHTTSHLELTDGVLLRLEDSVTDTSALAILARIGVKDRVSPRAAEARLCSLLNDRARALPYPPAALVCDRATGCAQEVTDLLSVCTVLSKCSGKLYLRDKEPNLGALQRSRRVVLRVPKGWRIQ